tara:strand:+ start:456 stop:1628 length:1173 start_codon:yes stop_codon:yes gene_type:complete
MKLKISILGSTGSIGSTTLKIIDKKKKLFSVNLLSAKKNIRLISNQIKKYNPKVFVVTDKKVYLKIKKKFKKSKTKIFNEFNNKSFLKSNITVSSIPGIAGLKPTISMVSVSKKILIANKESIICGWDLIKKKAQIHKTKIIPIDSEHFSILKLLDNHKIKDIKKIYLTASGGPFLNYKPNQLKSIKPELALKHPKWKMGKKISIDSATLMNKLLEIIEAQKLFNIPLSKLDVLIHPDSLVHAILELKNGLIKFIYHETTMVIPIANAIFENNLNIDQFYKINQNKKISPIENLKFSKVNKKIFPIFKLKDRANEFISTPIIINAANELLIDLFLKKKINFLDISKTIMKIMSDRNYKKYAIRNARNFQEIEFIDKWSKITTMKKLKIYV